MARPIGSAGGIGRLLAYAVADLLQNGDTYEPVVLSYLSSAVIDLLGAATRLAQGGRTMSSPESRRRTGLYGYIEEALRDPNLTPMAIAAAQGMSLRQLNRILQQDGRSPASYVRLRRLERCREALVDPAQRHVPVAAIGGVWGFPDPVTFGRAFRRVYGMAPGEYRRRFGGSSA